MTRFRSLSIRCLAYAAACSFLAGSLRLEAQPAIDHAGIECIATGKFALVLSGIDPQPNVHSARVYFRADAYPDFYYVAMTYEEGRYVGVLPKPLPETTQIFYYLEAVDTSFDGSRTIDWDPLVEECDDDPGAYLTGDQPGIIVGATTSGASPIPPGFSAAGIVGTIASSGIASGGGVGAGTAATVAAGLAAGVGAIVVSGGSNNSPTTSVHQDNEPLPEPATTSVGASNPSPATSSITNTTSISGSNTSTIVGTTTVVVSTSTTSVMPLDACFTVELLDFDNCRLRLDASCSSGPIQDYSWVLDPEGNAGGPFTASGSVVVQDFDKCKKETVNLTLTVNGSSGSDMETASYTFPKSGPKPLRQPETLGTSLTGFLGLPPFDGSVRGFVAVNVSHRFPSSNASPERFAFGGKTGTNVVEAMVASPGRAGFWKFDFPGAEHFVPGSFTVESGHILSQDGSSIQFRLSGSPGERIRFRYELTRTYRLFSPR